MQFPFIFTNNKSDLKNTCGKGLCTSSSATNSEYCSFEDSVRMSGSLRTTYDSSSGGPDTWPPKASALKYTHIHPPHTLMSIIHLNI